MMRQSPSVPVSHAALVPVVGALFFSVGLWRGPERAGAAAPLLPFIVELCLFWAPFGSLCVWFALYGDGKRRRRERARDVLIAFAGTLAAIGYLLGVRVPAWRAEWSPERFVTELFALASTTWHGLPLVALSAVLGWAAATAVFAFALGELLSRRVPRQRALQLRVLLSLPLFAIGSSAVLRYATGSPWPLIH